MRKLAQTPEDILWLIHKKVQLINDVETLDTSRAERILVGKSHTLHDFVEAMESIGISIAKNEVGHCRFRLVEISRLMQSAGLGLIDGGGTDDTHLF